MTIFTVTDCGNENQLQGFVKQATDGDKITFACSGTIMLTNTLIFKGTGKLTLDANGKSIILDGGNNVRVLLIDGIHLTLNGLTITGGKTDQESGGGLFISKSGELTIANSTISGNTAKHGGGLMNNGGKVTMTNCTITGNTASAWGGGLYNNLGGEVSISFSTIVNNTATIAGGLVAGYPPARISATIVANNTAKLSHTHNASDKIASQGFNLESGIDGDFISTDRHNLDPALDSAGLQHNGGSTHTIALQTGSPAIGAVSAQFCPLSDQRGYLRPIDIQFGDIGAYQSSYLAPPTPPSP
ncbi:hypothetical protein KSF_093970 [Reticulibacter mediterranei]|uniref:Right handed beta helix domain-containing protein n=1 Tax=Reticulibacter mediterranei TaxID=2778369 RepID=A0A8J3IWV4_9CHLR|nr:right-handed parallel beta-helix repeat-containing protein [Reticulibacter mediterranei]GHO99349.1 hypothetical protein KSF_093970 [Reticulibacter mediterranei]